MRKMKKYSSKMMFRKKEFLIPKDSLKSSWKMRATRLEHRRIEGKK